MEFEKLKKNNFPTDRPIPEKQGRIRGNKNIFEVGLTDDVTVVSAIRRPHSKTRYRSKTEP